MDKIYSDLYQIFLTNFHHLGKVVWLLIGAGVTFLVQNRTNDRVYEQHRVREREQDQLKVLADSVAKIYKLRGVVHNVSVDLCMVEANRNSGNSALFTHSREVMDNEFEKGMSLGLVDELEISAFHLRRIDDLTSKKFEPLVQEGKDLLGEFMDAAKDGGRYECFNLQTKCI